MRISDWSSDVCSSDLHLHRVADLVIDLDLRFGRSGGLFLRIEHPRGFLVADRLRLAARSQEARHLGRVLDEVVHVLGPAQPGEHNARHALALDLPLLSNARTGDRFWWSVCKHGSASGMERE